MKLKVGDQSMYLFNDTSYWVRSANETIFLGQWDYDGDPTDYPTKISALQSQLLRELFL